MELSYGLDLEIFKYASRVYIIQIYSIYFESVYVLRAIDFLPTKNYQNALITIYVLDFAFVN